MDSSAALILPSSMLPALEALGLMIMITLLSLSNKEKEATAAIDVHLAELAAVYLENVPHSDGRPEVPLPVFNHPST